MTGIWIILAILSFCVMSACACLLVRYSSRDQDKMLSRMDKRLISIEGRINEAVVLLRSLVEKVGNNKL